jgi:intracellular septation protein A
MKTMKKLMELYRFLDFFVTYKCGNEISIASEALFVLTYSIRSLI